MCKGKSCIYFEAEINSSTIRFFRYYQRVDIHMQFCSTVIMEYVCQISLLQAADSGKEDWTKLSFRDPVVIRKASDVALAAAASKSLVSDIPTCTLLLPYPKTPCPTTVDCFEFDCSHFQLIQTPLIRGQWSFLSSKGCPLFVQGQTTFYCMLRFLII